VGEDPLAETRLAVSAQRRDMERTADQLRDALDLRKRFRENPAAVLGLGAGAVFLLAGGPVRVARVVRRRLFRSDPEKAYDALPKPMQSWVDHMAGAVGPRAAEARQSLSEELLRWRHDPRKHGKVSKKLAKQIAEGPPGPRRAVWSAFEAGAAIITTALARKAVERFLSGEPRTAADPDPSHSKDDATPSSEESAQAGTAEYSGMSSRPRDT